MHRFPKEKLFGLFSFEIIREIQHSAGERRSGGLTPLLLDSSSAKSLRRLRWSGLLQHIFLLGSLLLAAEVEGGGRSDGGGCGGEVGKNVELTVEPSEGREIVLVSLEITTLGQIITEPPPPLSPSPCWSSPGTPGACWPPCPDSSCLLRASVQRPVRAPGSRQPPHSGPGKPIRPALPRGASNERRPGTKIFTDGNWETVTMMLFSESS